jgi:hypothetical protein
MEQKSEQVEAEQQRRQALFAMPKIVLHMVAFGLEDIIVFVFDLPPSAARLCHRCHRLSRHLMIRDKAEWIHVLLPALLAALRTLGDAPTRSQAALAQRLGVSEADVAIVVTPLEEERQCR